MWEESRFFGNWFFCIIRIFRDSCGPVCRPQMGPSWERGACSRRRSSAGCPCSHRSRVIPRIPKRQANQTLSRQLRGHYYDWFHVEKQSWLRWSWWYLGAVSEAIAHLLYRTYMLWAILTVTTVVVFVTSARSLQYRLPIGPKWSIVEEMSQKVVGSNPGVVQKMSWV